MVRSDWRPLGVCNARICKISRQEFTFFLRSFLIPTGYKSLSPGLSRKRLPWVNQTKNHPLPGTGSINPTHTVHQIRFHIVAITDEAHPETIPCDDVLPASRCSRAPIRFAKTRLKKHRIRFARQNEASPDFSFSTTTTSRVLFP